MTNLSPGKSITFQKIFLKSLSNNGFTSRFQLESKSILKSWRMYRHRVHQFYRIAVAVATCARKWPWNARVTSNLYGPIRNLKGVRRILSRASTRVHVRVW